MLTEPMRRYGASLTGVRTRNCPSSMITAIATRGIKNFREVDAANEVETMTMLGKELYLSRRMATLNVNQIEVNKPRLLS